MKLKTEIWKGIEVKSTTVDPRFDIWHKAYIIGFNPFTNKLIICDEEGCVKFSLAIRNTDGTEMNKRQYNTVLQEIREVGRLALNEVRNNGISSY